MAQMLRIVKYLIYIALNQLGRAALHASVLTKFSYQAYLRSQRLARRQQRRRAARLRGPPYHRAPRPAVVDPTLLRGLLSPSSAANALLLHHHHLLLSSSSAANALLLHHHHLLLSSSSTIAASLSTPPHANTSPTAASPSELWDEVERSRKANEVARLKLKDSKAPNKKQGPQKQHKDRRCGRVEADDGLRRRRVLVGGDGEEGGMRGRRRPWL